MMNIKLTAGLQVKSTVEQARDNMVAAVAKRRRPSVM